MAIPTDIRQSLAVSPIDLPVFHPVALKLTIMLSDPYSDMEDIVKAINEDQALVVNVLKMANSAAYMGLVNVETIRDAVVRLGAKQTSMLAMAVSQASLHVSENRLFNGVMKELWQHSLACGLGGWWVAQQTGRQSISDQAYLAGLLHDIGKLYLLKALERLSHDKENGIVLERQLLLKIFVEMHVEQGCRIMEHWNIPPVYRSVVARHHAEQYNPVDSLTTIVRLVNGLSRKVNLSLNPEPFDAESIAPEVGLLDLDETQCDKLESVIRGYSEVHGHVGH